MLSDSQVMKVSLVVSVVGLVALFLVTLDLEPNKVSLNEITDSMVGQRIQASGMIKALSVKEGTVFFTLVNGSELNIVVFEKDARRGKFNETTNGENVTVDGTLNFYRGELELIATKVYK
ncbi:MAG: exodeoxyribonuclease VII large subunit [Candidatus Aenigmarchaeota archaeon]|nr:exodeoxyribonuclease VII large subunit [Candidatus Aenigmarchaeota archaeon]